MSQEIKQLRDILSASDSYLQKKGIDEASLKCEILAGRLLGCKRLELPERYQEMLSDKQIEAMRRGVKRLADGEPVQYITGEAGFMGHNFKTDSRSLIPRPETETLVELILKCDELWQRENPAVLEIGTGSGCIAISIALAKPKALYMALDISADAVSLAKENAELLGVADKIGFGCGEMADLVDPETIDIVVANLPYIPTAEYEQLPRHIKDFEPRQALDGGADGLVVIAPIVQDASFVLKPGGYIFLEIGDAQGEAVKNIVDEAGFEGVSVVPDLNNKDRIVTGRMPI